jgi:hypothetical protein
MCRKDYSLRVGLECVCFLPDRLILISVVSDKKEV